GCCLPRWPTPVPRQLHLSDIQPRTPPTARIIAVFRHRNHPPQGRHRPSHRRRHVQRGRGIRAFILERCRDAHGGARNGGRLFGEKGEAGFPPRGVGGLLVAAVGCRGNAVRGAVAPLLPFRRRWSLIEGGRRGGVVPAFNRCPLVLAAPQAETEKVVVFLDALADA